MQQTFQCTRAPYQWIIEQFPTAEISSSSNPYKLIFGALLGPDKKKCFGKLRQHSTWNNLSAKIEKKNKAQTYDYEYRYNKAYLQFFSDPGLGTDSAQVWTSPTRGHVNLDKIILNVIFDDIWIVRIVH